MESINKQKSRMERYLSRLSKLIDVARNELLSRIDKEELFYEILRAYLDVVRLEHGQHQGWKSKSSIEHTRNTLHCLLNKNSTHPLVIAMNEVLVFLENGDEEGAKNKVKAIMNDPSIIESQMQSHRRKGSIKSDPLNHLIDSIIKHSPRISFRELLEIFKSKIGCGVIVDVYEDTEEIEITLSINKRTGEPIPSTMTFNALSARLSRRKKFNYIKGN